MLFRSQLELSHKESGIHFQVQIREHKEFLEYHENVRYEWVAGEELGFDHGKIILYTLLRLRKQIKCDLRLAFDLMPEYFTLTDLQSAFEITLDKELIKPNFRRKIVDYVVETEKTAANGGHRPAKLFKRNAEMFYK